jgi:PhoH-like ATPase
MTPQRSGVQTSSPTTSRQTKESTATAAKGRQAERTFVLDTSVLLSDPTALFRFAEHSVVIPVIVISELEKKRHDPEIGYFARQALRALDDLRIKHERLDFPIPLEGGGSIRVELNHSNQSVLPSGLQLGDNDSRILAVALNLAGDGLEVTVVSKDLPMRVKAASIGLSAEEYRAELATDPSWLGTSEVTLSSDDMADLYETEKLRTRDVIGLPLNTGLVIHSDRGSALGRIVADGEIHLVRGDRDLFGLHGRSAEQRLAIDMLLDSQLGIVSLGGRAGTGKSALALCAGLEAVLERQQHKKIVVFRPLYAVGGQELGYLPGDQGEKMNPWGQAIFDTLGALVSQNVIDEVVERGLLEVLPLTHIRGRSLHDAFVIVDEAQSLERNVLLTVLSRIGQNSRVVLTHDVAQRDNLRVGRHDGVASVIESLKGQSLFAHITLTRSERSAIAALVTELLEGN